MRPVVRILIVCVGLVSAPGARADHERAHINYMLHCQGCHLADAMGFEGRVPRMNGFVGKFLETPAGRAFIIQVPGVATSALPDDQLTELMNWMLVYFSAEQIPDDFDPYTLAEVAALRRHPVADPVGRRAEVLAAIAAQRSEGLGDAQERDRGDQQP
jgi:hypothetical protein